MVVNVIGLGYIGLPTALMFASHGVKVVGTDYNEELIGVLKSGLLPFEEKGMEDLFSTAVQCGNMAFTDEYIKTEVYIIAVPTPYNEENKKIDPHFVVAAVKQVLAVCPDNAVIVIESTVSPGTIDRYVRPVVEESHKKVELAHAPERIIPGNMIYELKHNSRTIGVDNMAVGSEVKRLYASFCRGEIVLTSIRTAEMTKVVENTYRDINIAFANELTKICRQDDMDVYEIIRIANMHPRVNILQPGPGVGGHCISVDPWFLVGDYPNLSLLIHEARKINDSMPAYVLARVRQIMDEKGISDPSRVGLYGLTYKEDVDDIRESPTLQLLKQVRLHLGHSLSVYDPMIEETIVSNQYTDFDHFLKDIDMVVIMVGHTHLKDNMAKLSGKVVLDTRNICNLPGVCKL